MENLPVVIRLLADALPLTYFVNIMRGLITGGTTIPKLMPDVLMLGIWFVASLTTFIWISRLRRFKTN
jgi:uncharacterized phage infection (PIP) family protein YhgE